MKLKEFKTKLDEFDDDITVCIGDWSECYSPSYEVPASEMVVTEGDYHTEHGYKTHGKFLRIGNDDD